VLIPDQDEASLTLQLAIIGGVGTFRIVRRAALFRRQSADPLGGWRYVVRRLGLSAIACIGVLVVAALVPTNPVSAFYWLVGVILIYLTSAADSAWDLLIEVGRQRRRRTG